MEFTIFIVAFLAIVAISIFFYYVPFFLWISARVSGVRISLIQLFLMRIRKVPARIIVQAIYSFINSASLSRGSTFKSLT